MGLISGPSIQRFACAVMSPLTQHSLPTLLPHLTFSQCTSIVYPHQTQQQDVSVFPKAVFGFLSLFLLALGLEDRAHFTRRQLTDCEDEELEGRARERMWCCDEAYEIWESPLWTMMRWECPLHEKTEEGAWELRNCWVYTLLVWSALP